jgi:alpha-glucosidase
VRPAAFFLLLAGAVFAQDERRVTSPNGQIEFRIFTATQPNSNLSRIAYEVFLKGKPLVQTSYLGLDIQDQEPLLGENVGQTSSTSTTSAKYNSLTAKYMQNGSLGRLINIEARAYNDGVAFRYVIPQSTPLVEFVVTEEATEFRFRAEVSLARVQVEEICSSNISACVSEGGAGWFVPMSETDPISDAVFEVAATWIGIAESKQGKYPPMRLVRSDPTTYVTRPFPSKPGLEATTPLNIPWRIISIGPDPKSVLKSGIIADLNR